MSGHSFGGTSERAQSTVTAALACPHCGSALQPTDDQLVCDIGHSFNIARQGYASLLGGGRRAATGDTAAMTAARAAFLATDHYRLIAEAVSRTIPADARGLCLDIAGGTGYYLAAVLDDHPDLAGLSVDLSPFAARRAARAHERAAAVTADVWQAFPVRTGAVRYILSIFGPRNGPEMHRVLEPNGLLVVATPTDRHLLELRQPLGLINVDSHKQDRLATQLCDFTRVREVEVEYVTKMSALDVENDVQMGPNAHHVDASTLAQSIRALPDPTQVTISVRVSSYVPTHTPAA